MGEGFAVGVRGREQALEVLYVFETGDCGFNHEIHQIHEKGNEGATRIDDNFVCFVYLVVDKRCSILNHGMHGIYGSK